MQIARVETYPLLYTLGSRMGTQMGTKNTGPVS